MGFLIGVLIGVVLCAYDYYKSEKEWIQRHEGAWDSFYTLWRETDEFYERLKNEKMKNVSRKNCDCNLCEGNEHETKYKCPKCKMAFSENHYLMHVKYYDTCPNCVNRTMDKFEIVSKGKAG